MSMNVLGKFLVCVHLTLAVTALTWAGGLFLQFLDWGWIEPRVHLGKRIASEFDKRNIVQRDWRRQGDMQVPAMLDANKKLREVRNQYPLNYLIYGAYIDNLRNKIDPDGKPIDFLAPSWRGGDLVRDKPGRYFDPPLLAGRLPGVENSTKGYHAELEKTEKDIKVELKKHLDWIDKHAAVSQALNGKRVGKVVEEPGLYDLLEEEKNKQDAAKRENEYLKPNWARALQEAEVFGERRASLEKTIEKLRIARKLK